MAKDSEPLQLVDYHYLRYQYDSEQARAFEQQLEDGGMLTLDLDNLTPRDLVALERAVHLHNNRLMDKLIIQMLSS